MRIQVRNPESVPSLTGGLPKLALSRGKTPLVLDEHLLFPKEPRQKKGFTVLVPRAKKLNEEIVAEDLPGRIFATNNPRDFVYSASLLDYSIIDTRQSAIGVFT